MDLVVAIVGLASIGLSFWYRAYQDKKAKESHATLDALARRDRDELRAGLDQLRKP